jgi:FtsP/CotA-like multicopper oxidase with cupredoxin domain
MKKPLTCSLSILFLFVVIVYMSGCTPSSTSISHTPSQLPDTIDLVAVSKKDSVMHWTRNHLFKNNLDPSKVEKIYLTAQNDSAAIEIRAFRHRFFDDESILPATWVLGYVNASTPIGKERLPGPTIETRYGVKTRIHFENKLESTLIKNDKYPLFKYKGKVCKWYPIIYNLDEKNHIGALADMLYTPLSKDVNGITICGRGMNTDSIPEMASYYGTTVHLHGSNSAWRYDGYPNNHYWDGASSKNTSHGIFGPNEIENGIARTSLTHYYTNDFPEPNFTGTDTTQGKHGAVLWYHDHAMMHTAAHVYAGLLAPYIIDGEDENTLFSDNSEENHDVYVNRETSGRFYWRTVVNWFTELFGGQATNNDIPLVINDKSFLKNGLLYYNTTADSLSSESPKDTNAIIQPEFFGNVMVVNGKAWPNMPVDKQVYRFRVLNTCSSRTLSLALGKKQNNETGFSFDKDTTAKCYQIGTESGLIPVYQKITIDKPLTLAPGERADILIDFGKVDGLQEIALLNFAPNSPYGSDSTSIMPIADVNAMIQRGDTLTNVVMQFSLKGSINSEDELEHKLEKVEKDKSFSKLVHGIIDRTELEKDTIRNKSLSLYNLDLTEYTSFASLSGTQFKDFMQKDPYIYPIVLMNQNNWDSEKGDTSRGIPANINQVDDDSDYKIWRIVNNTPDMHPIHIHLNRFEVIGRCTLENDKDNMPVKELTPPNLHEIGWKDVVQCPKGQITYIRIKYKLNHNQDLKYAEQSDPAQFVYHCHILEHEDVSMMRRLVVKPK